MKLYNFFVGDDIHLGMMTPGGVLDLTAINNPSLPRTMEEAICMNDWDLDHISSLDRPLLKPESLRLAPAVPNPGKIICVGLNYRRHALETGSPIPAEPIIFSKFENALAASGQEIPMPARGEQVDYEAELVIVMGRQAKNITEAQAMDTVFGYTVGNDLSIRELQFATGQWLIGKTADGFAPVGPCVVTADALDPGNLRVTTRVNGELRQNSNTADLIFSCAQIISHLSKLMTLKPGDLIFTGTPEGVILGYPKEEQVWLKARDEVVCEIEGIGALTNRLAPQRI